MISMLGATRYEPLSKPAPKCNCGGQMAISIMMMRACPLHGPLIEQSEARWVKYFVSPLPGDSMVKVIRNG